MDFEKQGTSIPKNMGGNSSAVERHVANVDVAGSNPVSRSILFFWTHPDIFGGFLFETDLFQLFPAIFSKNFQMLYLLLPGPEISDYNDGAVFLPNCPRASREKSGPSALAMVSSSLQRI